MCIGNTNAPNDVMNLNVLRLADREWGAGKRKKNGNQQ
jgi:hypothetical protein